MTTVNYFPQNEKIDSLVTLKKLYFELVKVYHPDVG